jgi:glycosyltransferase involved in cell wall biosynthesis
VSHPTPELTVIVTTHNRADVIDDTLEALAAQRWDDGTWDILIVDNDSTDDTVAIAETWLTRLPVPARILHAAQRHHPGYARNTAVAATTARNVAFVDDDDLVGPGWVAAIGTALRDHEFVASRSEYHRLNPPKLAATGAFQTERLGRHLGVEIVDSAGSGLRRSHWHALGGSSEDIRGVEDTDFALRMHQRGVRPHFCADAVYSVRLRHGFRPAFRRGLGRGHGEVRLFRDHGATLGARRDRAVVTVGRWLRLAAQAPSLVSPTKRVLWAEHAGRRVGRARACVTERTWYP